jgi:hypothetical protein
MSVKFKSEYFDNINELTQAKDDAWRGVSQRRERLGIIRKFSNGLATMTKEEAQAAGRTEIVNHLTTYTKLIGLASAYESMATGQKNLVEIIVDTNNPEEDQEAGARLSEAVNRGAVCRKGKFAQFWRKCAGEIVMAGGVPVTFGARYGWLPTVDLDMFFPKESELDAEKMTFAFVPQEMTHSDLKELEKEVSSGSSSVTNVKNVKKLIAILDQRIKDSQGKTEGFGQQEVTRPVRDQNTGGDNLVIDCWSYYEIKFAENGTRYVSKTLFTDTLDTTPGQDSGIKQDEPSSETFLISFQEKAHDEAAEWLHMVCIDSEIGGLKNTDTIRGVAELIYPSATEMEDLFNRTLEGDKIRATPKMKVTSSANADAVAQWDINSDSFVPDGLEEMQFNATSQNLQTPISYLTGTVSDITMTPRGSVGNSGELRVDAVDRQEASAGVRSNRLSEAYDVMDTILESVVYRLFRGDLKAGADGYMETKWVRAFLKSQAVDYKKLSERKNGQFLFLRVRARRSIGNGDRQNQIETSDWLMDRIQSFDPTSRPLIMRTATALHTQDQDLAEQLVTVPKTLLNAQKVTAENEYDTIARRSALGQSISVQPGDVHQEHLPIHLLDLQSLLAHHQYEPWGQIDVLVFGGMLDHIGEHLQILLGNPATNFEGQQFLQDFQALVTAGRPIIQQVEEQQESLDQQLTPKEEAELQLKAKDQERKWQELGLKASTEEALQENRRSRERLAAANQATAHRRQLTNEISDDRRQTREDKQLTQSRVENIAKAKESTTNKDTK